MQNGNGSPVSRDRPKRWWLLVIAAPAAVAIWSGWVGLGQLCGFGPVTLLPGITGWTLNTAITLPVGVEAYAAFALGAWIAPATPGRARTFARWSAVLALAYGMAGQITYHLLAAAHAGAAPWPVVVAVSCMPVAVLGLAAGLTHLLRAGDPETASEPVQPEPAGKVPSSRVEAAKTWYAATVAVGNPASVNKLQQQFSLTRAEATEARTPDSPAGVAPPSMAAPAGSTLNGSGPHE